MRHIKKILLSCLFFTLILIYVFSIKNTNQNKWYENVSMYHVFVKSFYDTNNDGKGDIQGLISKLDYIKSLNVNTIHVLPLTPSFNSPDMLRSHLGYETLDYKNINPDYGNLDDFKQFVKQAHKQDLHVVLDFVTTFISDKHPIFKDIKSNPNSKYKDWILRSKTIPDGQWMNFNDYHDQYESSAWNQLPDGDYYYSLWGNFPFLNYHNPEVQEYIISILDFWLDLGVDGIRIDATKHLFINGPGVDKQYHQPENFKFFKRLRKHITKKYGTDKLLIAETVPIPEDVQYVTKNREMFDMMFDTTFVFDIYNAFEVDLSNHYSASFLNSFFKPNLSLEITPLKNRLLYHSDHDTMRLAARATYPTEEDLKTAASILVLTPAHIKIYAGDEIGTKGITSFENQKEKKLHVVLTTMSWDDTKNGGFTKADNTILPISDDYKDWNVKEQDNRKDSLLNHYRALFKLKNEYPEYFFKGNRFALDGKDENLYAYFLTNKKSAALVIINLNDTARSFFATSPTFEKAGRIKQIFGDKVDFTKNNNKFSTDKLPPYSTTVFQFKKFPSDILEKKENKNIKWKTISVGQKQTYSSGDRYQLQMANNAFIRIFKGQGKVTVSLSRKVEGANSFTFYSDTVDTSNNDILLPTIYPYTSLNIETDKNIDFDYQTYNQGLDAIFNPKTKLYAKNDKNTSLKKFWAGKDDNFWYLKLEKDKYALPSNGGLDFIFLINDKEPILQDSSLSFWNLPKITSKNKFHSLALYQRHNQNYDFQTDISESKQIGRSNRGQSFIFNEEKAFYLMLPRSILKNDKLYVAPFVWSSSGRWGDTPLKGSTLPIVERLTKFNDKNYNSNVIEDYMEIE